VLLTPTRLEAVRDVVGTLAPEIPVYVVDQKTMNAVVGFNIHRGVLALGARGPEPELERLLDDSSCVVVLEDLVNHDNIGGIFRNVAALAGVGRGGGAVLLSPNCSDPLYRKSIRVSIGWALAVPFARLVSWPADLNRLRSSGFRVVALHPGAGARDIAAVAEELGGRGQKIALVVGTEGPGLTPECLAAADECVRIPMRGREMLMGSANAEGVDSLNVGVATAIALHRFAAALPQRERP
jgi:tRNA G18 (ribose-2'-O)-methylase SpoU